MTCFKPSTIGRHLLPIRCSLCSNRHQLTREQKFLGPIPPAPRFDESIEDIRARIEMMIGKTPIIQRD